MTVRTTSIPKIRKIQMPVFALLSSGTHFWQNWPIFPQYFSKSKKFYIFCGFAWYKPWRYMKNQQKTGLKPFLASENHDFSLFLLKFSYINYIGKCAISVTPSHTQTQIS